MSFTTPIFLPLTKGLDLSKEATLGGDDLVVAENVDFEVDGQIRGRPARRAPINFEKLNSTTAVPTYAAAAAFDALGETPLGLMSLRDGSGAKPMLGTQGRLFVKDAESWKDRGHFACARVDKLFSSKISDSGAVARSLVAPDFVDSRTSTGNYVALLAEDGTFQKFQAATSMTYPGGSARCGAVTAALSSTANTLRIYMRSGAAVSEATLAVDAATSSQNGDAPAICCDHDQTVFFVVYRTTTANQYKVLRVTAAGAVTHTYTGTIGATLQGIWIANSPVAGNRIVVALGKASDLVTYSGSLFLQTLTASNLADPAIDSTLTATAVYGGTYTCARQVTVGFETSTKVWFAACFQEDASTLPDSFDVIVGTCDPTSSNSTTEYVRYYHGLGVTTTMSYWNICHQPILINGRMYLTLACAPWSNQAYGTGNYAGTWITLDLTNMVAGPQVQPVMVARGKSLATAITKQPESAVVFANADASGWTFATHDFTQFGIDGTGNVLGTDAVTSLTRVKFSGPRAVIVGGATLISGSVAHMLAGESSCEVGFPFMGGGPSVFATAYAAGALTSGDYAVTAVWKYVDAAGQVHRSAPAPTYIATLAPGSQNLRVFVANPQVTERRWNDVSIEVYVSTTPATDESTMYLQTVVAPSTGFDGCTRVDLTALVSDSEQVYSYGDAFIHSSVPADGGIATAGNRVWVADASTAYASLLLEPGKGPAWNDEGSLQVNLPAGAGRIVSLEGFEDKLVIFCEQGVYAVQSGGPNNVGEGADMGTPVCITDLGCAGPRSTCLVDKGVVFCSPLNEDYPHRGGPWFINKGLALGEYTGTGDESYLGRQVAPFLAADAEWVPEVAFSFERQQLYVGVPAADGVNNSGVVVIDMRVGKWATWLHDDETMGQLRSLATVGGVLWTLGDEPVGYDSAPPGTDEDAGPYQMRIATGHKFSNGSEGLGWARIRSVNPMSAVGGGSHTLTIGAVLDQTRTLTSGALSVAAATVDTTWPTSKQDREWRLPTQKCSSIQVELKATPAVARWSAIRLETQPQAHRAPAKNRS